MKCIPCTPCHIYSVSHVPHVTSTVYPMYPMSHLQCITCTPCHICSVSHVSATPSLMAKIGCQDYAFVDFIRKLLMYKPSKNFILIYISYNSHMDINPVDPLPSSRYRTFQSAQESTYTRLSEFSHWKTALGASFVMC